MRRVAFQALPFGEGRMSPFSGSLLHPIVAGETEGPALHLEGEGLLGRRRRVTGITLPLQHRRMRDLLQKGSAV